MYHGDLMASLLGVIFSKPIFWNIRHGKMSLRYSSRKTLIIRFILSILSYTIPEGIISCSYCGLEVHQKIGYFKKKFHVIHNGIDIDKEISQNYNDLLVKKSIKIASNWEIVHKRIESIFLNVLEILSNYGSFEGIIIGRGIRNSSKLKKG